LRVAPLVALYAGALVASELVDAALLLAGVWAVCSAVVCAGLAAGCAGAGFALAGGARLLPGDARPWAAVGARAKACAVDPGELALQRQDGSAEGCALRR
jgi:hypothetical protein